MILTVLRNLHQVFYKMHLSLSISDIFPMIILRLCVLRWMITEVAILSSHIQGIHYRHDLSVMMLKPQSHSWDSACQFSPLYCYFPQLSKLLLFGPEYHPMVIGEREGLAELPVGKNIYIYSWNSLYRRFSSSPFICVFNHLFLLAWAH